LSTPKLVEHFFRHEIRQARRYAVAPGRRATHRGCRGRRSVRLDDALETWTIAGLPDNPSAWLFRVAHKPPHGELRQRTARRRILEQNAEKTSVLRENGPEIFLAGEVRDDLLRGMLFVCCDEASPVESQAGFALKTLCGFDIREIALRLFTSEAMYTNDSVELAAICGNIPSPRGILPRAILLATSRGKQDPVLLFTEGTFPARGDGYPPGALQPKRFAGCHPWRNIPSARRRKRSPCWL